MIRRALRPLAAGAVAAVLAACAIGPDFKPPSPPKARDYGSAPIQGETAAVPAAGPGGNAQRFIAGMDIPAQWWTLFQSPKLNALVEQALRANPDVAAAKAALRQAHELYAAQRATLFPTVQASLDGTRARNAVGTIANPTNLPQQNPYYNLYTAQLTVSYLPDVFGATRRAVELARAQENGSRFQLEAVYLTLTSNVVVTAVEEASLRGQIAATTRLIEIQHHITETTREQRVVGTASNLDVLTQEAAEAQIVATLPVLHKQLGQARDALTALLGRLPAEEPAETFQLGELTLPSEIPVTIPSHLVEHRPDVRQAEENLHAASAAAGVALADLLPQFAITADLGSSAFRFNQLLTAGTGFWNVGASLTQTLFDAGALLHRRGAAYAALDEAGDQYRSSVILACQNVADSLRALQADADALKASAEGRRAAGATLDLARHQLPLGTVSEVAVLSAEQTALQAELSFVQARASRYSDTAALFQALGGGWWNRPQRGSP